MKYKHTNIISKDWERLVEFYVTVFQCKIVPPVRQQSGTWLDKGTGLTNAQLSGAHLLLPGHGEKGPTLEIYQYQEIKPQGAVPANQRGFGHLAFEVDEVDAVLEQVLQNGGQSLGEVSRKALPGLGELTFVYARDPEGNIIELQSWN